MSQILLMAKHDNKAVLRFPKTAIGHNGKPNLINMDTSGANKAREDRSSEERFYSLSVQGAKTKRHFLSIEKFATES